MGLYKRDQAREGQGGVDGETTIGRHMNEQGNVQSVISENLKSMQTQKSLSEGRINLLNQLSISLLFSNKEP